MPLFPAQGFCFEQQSERSAKKRPKKSKGVVNGTCVTSGNLSSCHLCAETALGKLPPHSPLETFASGRLSNFSHFKVSQHPPEHPLGL